MSTLVLDPPPVELQALLERRKRLDLDRHDEVWEGVLHMAPAPRNAHTDIQQQLSDLLGPLARRAGLHPMLAGELNIGEPEDHRIPDGALLRARENVAWNPTAAFVVEIVSPGDESWQKLPFYAAHHVDELLIVDPATRKVDWLALAETGMLVGGERPPASVGGAHRQVKRSGLIDFGPAELAAQIDWPPDA